MKTKAPHNNKKAVSPEAIFINCFENKDDVLGELESNLKSYVWLKEDNAVIKPNCSMIFPPKVNTGNMMNHLMEHKIDVRKLVNEEKATNKLETATRIQTLMNLEIHLMGNTPNGNFGNLKFWKWH